MEPKEDYGEYTGEELDLFGEFTESLNRGENPDIEEYVARLKDGSKERLRTSLDNAVWFYGLVQGFKRECPGKSVWDVLGITEGWERATKAGGQRAR
jgi:hypothetical protein